MVAVSSAGKIYSNPSPSDILESASLHVFSFLPNGDPLLVESEGDFSIDEWNDALGIAQELCCGHTDKKRGEDDMDTEEERPSMQSFLVDTISKKVNRDLKWKEEST